MTYSESVAFRKSAPRVQIVIHSSKTMRKPVKGQVGTSHKPILLNQATELSKYIQTLDHQQIERSMKVSPKLALAVKDQMARWTKDPAEQQPAVDCFLGDIYSGLQVAQWTEEDRAFAHKHLRILSGLYGVVRALDGISPYRLEMGYRLPDEPYKNLYTFWGDTVAKTFDESGPIIDLSAVEYSRVITPYIDGERFIAPRFLTYSPKLREPTFVVVHTKIARGAFAGWMIRNRIQNIDQLTGFSEIGYSYDPDLSTPQQPTFVCKEFGGLGLSVRLS